MAKAKSPLAYPALPDGLETRLAAIEIAAAANSDFFTSPDCPYPERLRDFLRRLVVQASLEPVSARSFELKGDEDKFDVLIAEIEATIGQMTLLEGSLSDADTGDRIQFVKAKTSLLEKWVSMKERVYSVREMAEFQAIVVRFLDDQFSKDQRHAFIEAMRGLRSAAPALEKLQDARGEG